MSQEDMLAGAAQSEYLAKVVKIVGAAFCTIPLAIVGMALSRIFSTLMTSMSHNPIIIDKGATLILIVSILTETIGLLIMLIACLILFIT